MGERLVDRAAWAGEVQRLVAEQTRGNKTAFALKVGVNAKTIDRWIRREVDVKAESVHQVARACALNPMDLLARVGFYSPAEMATPGSEVDEEIELVRTDPRLDTDMKMRIVNLILDRRRREREQGLEQTRQIIETFRSAG